MKNYSNLINEFCISQQTLLKSDNADVRVQTAAKITRVAAWTIYSKYDSNCRLIQVKPPHTNVKGYSVDKLLFVDTMQLVDVLNGAGDKGGSTPSWQVKDGRGLTGIIPPFESFESTTPVPGDPEEPVDPADDLIDILSQILRELTKLNAHLGVK